MQKYHWKIKLVDLGKQYNLYKDEINSRINNVIRNSDFILGEELEFFEKKFANYCNKKYAIGLNSGTDAIKLGLLAHGVKSGDEIITVANGYFSVASSIVELGCKAIFIDIKKDTYLMDIEKIEKYITKKTKGIIPVHLYGQSVEMDKVMSLARKYKLFIIEDVCQAHGAIFKGKILPYSETGAFSFYPGKNLGGFGDGGALVTDNALIADKLRFLRNDGSVNKYVHPILGYKSRLDSLQAAILNAKLPHLAHWNSRRFKIAQMYTKILNQISGIETPGINPENSHVFHLYVIQCKKRDKLREFLSLNGVETGIHYPIPIHLQEPFKKIGYAIGDLPVTEEVSNYILSLPIYPELKDEEIEYICSKIKVFMTRK